MNTKITKRGIPGFCLGFKSNATLNLVPCFIPKAHIAIFNEITLVIGASLGSLLKPAHSGTVDKSNPKKALLKPLFTKADEMAIKNKIMPISPNSLGSKKPSQDQS